MRCPQKCGWQILLLFLLPPVLAAQSSPIDGAAPPLFESVDRADTAVIDTAVSDTAVTSTLAADARPIDTADTDAPAATPLLEITTPLPLTDASGIADTLIPIEMPPVAVTVGHADLPDAFVTDATIHPFGFGMVLATPDSETVALEYREEPTVPEAEPIFVDSTLASAHLASGTSHMHAERFDLAREDFEATLAADPNNVDALNSLGYLNAWSARYREATDAFQRTLAIDSQNFEAAKGLAYLAKWSGRHEEASARFGALAAARPDDLELATQHGQALLAAKRSSEAKATFESVLKLDPENIDARNGIRIARSAKPKVELTSWLGVTWFDDEERPRADANLGFRFVEVAIWPSSNSRLWFQYDNGLTLDNVVLSAGNRAVPAGYVGGFLNYERQHTTRLEVGWRSLPGTIGEVLFRSEHVVTLPQRYAIKGGLWLGLRSDDRTESILHAGLTVPIGDRFELNPTVFYATNGMPNEREWRILVAGEYRFPTDFRLSGGFAGGQASTGYIDDFRPIWDRYLKISAPVGQFHRAHALLRTEFIGETDATTVFAVGLTLGLSER